MYLNEKLSENKRPNLVRGRVAEAVRMSKRVGGREVYVYIRYVYTDTKKLLSEV